MESTRNKLIGLLANTKDSYISGQVLSEQLHISRAAIWKHMKELEKDGFEIEGKSRLGYRILKYPDKMSENTIQWGLHTNWLGKTIIHKEKTTSTQEEAHLLAKENAAHGTVIIADEQTKGKGRMDRNWYSMDKLGIWMSIVLKPDILPHQAPQLTLLAATVLADVFRQFANVHPQIKWPNDILINRKKTAGILTELQAEQDKIQYVVIGIGINVNHARNDFPEGIYEKATSLHMEIGKTLHIKMLVQEILTAFERAYDAYLEYGFMPTKKKWEHYGFKIGERISIHTMKDSWQATFKGIADDGALLIQNPNGDEQKLYSAEIDWFEKGGNNGC